jgi:DNA polymerase-3 subunit beta
MKIDCIKEKIELAIRIASRLVEKNPSLPILSCFLVDSKRNSLIIKATNLDLGVEVEVPVKGELPRSLAVPGSVLFNLISNLGNERLVSMDLTDNSVLKISSGSVEASIKTLPTEDFPVIPKISSDTSFTLPASVLVRGVKSVFYSAASNSIKPELSSVYLCHKDGFLVFVATDSFRLAEKKIKVKLTNNFPPVMIPIKNISEIIKILETTTDDVEVVVGKNQISFSTGFIYVVSRLVEGNFPDYEQIIPKNFSTSATILKQDFFQAVKAITVFTDSFNQININILPNKKIFEVKAKNNSLGDAFNKINTQASGEGIDVGFNYRYLLDCLPAVESDSLFFGFSGQHKPLVIRAAADQGFTYLVMPLNK